ncbi:hypothetical protein X797_010539 [Metarhizium robertsii]|uniref:DUF3472 domain protein n=2 Tax=Metarhizium robertsii TaxID=568076 RepID=E9FBC7_METRA|nr:uncharacterized protein MAA_09576 [Metarhizium robertsii ARSEF 23]EFY94998.1 hypothetical protein MAA_09576 [Metarhizium robertsii ARSEF 23]EXU96421.1 hypothetical protein X797_010539 [Metarhizium robertsii]
MKCSLTTVAAFAPQLGLALVGNDWSFPGRPWDGSSDGLRDITFPFNMAGASHDSGYYFAQQFNFHNVPDVGYCGIQNRPDDNGKSIVHAVFSSFQEGTTADINDENCHDGADGGPGVSCSVQVTGDYSHTYLLVIENNHGTTWTGTVVNTVTGNRTRVGTYTLPYGAGGIQPRQVGFVEYYPWNVGGPDCSQLPKTEVTMYDPWSNTPGVGNGTMGRPYEYGQCVGRVKFSSQKLPDGYNIDVGF